MSSSTEYSSPDDQPPCPPQGSDPYWEIKVVCPCKKCKNKKMTKRRLSDVHLQRNGRHIPSPGTSMTVESSEKDDIKSESEKQDTPMDGVKEAGANELLHDCSTSDGKADNSPSTRLVGTPLYPDATISVEEPSMFLWDLKVKHGFTDKSFTCLLRLLADELLPKENKMPRSIGELCALMKNSGIDMAAVETQKNTPLKKDKKTSQG